MESLAAWIAKDLQTERYSAVYENDLNRIWPLPQKEQEARLREFTIRYGFRLRFYHERLCAVFDKEPPSKGN